MRYAEKDIEKNEICKKSRKMSYAADKGRQKNEVCKKPKK
jgi:hypothetical protein